MIVLGKKYNLDDWLAPAFVDLIARTKALHYKRESALVWISSSLSPMAGFGLG
jgi:hypothetical protein